VNICIIGAGGLGSLIGGRLAEAGVDVTLVARPAHVDAIRMQGLHITGLRGDSTVTEHLHAVTHPDQAAGEFDYAILLVKAKDTESTLAQAARLRERTAVALSLQNTVVKENQLAAWLGEDRVIGASTTEAGTLVEPGVVRHVATAPTACYFGELSGGSSPRVETLVAVMNEAGIASDAADDIAHVEWEKLLQISVVAGWSASIFGALGGSMAEGLVVREAAEHYVQLATELFAVYRAMGFEPRDFFAPFSQFQRFGSSTFEERVDQVMELGSGMRAQGFVGRPSLHDDLLRGRETEVDYSIGAYLDEAEKYDTGVPTVRAAYRIIKSLEFWLGLSGGVEVHPLPAPTAAAVGARPPDKH
jgi:2-dehydropantoate 2-reductase